MQRLCKTLAAALLPWMPWGFGGLTPVSLCHAYPALQWDAPDAPPSTARLTAWRGETVELRPRFLQRGVPAGTNGWAFTLYWQSEGMGGSWYSDPTNALAWTPARDNGSSEYRAFIRADTPGGANYRANLRVTLLDSPGAAPNSLPLPAKVLDFSACELRGLEALTNGWTFGGPADLAPATNYTDAATNAVLETVNTKQEVQSLLQEKADEIWVAMMLTPAPVWSAITNAPVPWSRLQVYSLTLTDGGTLDFTGDWPVGASAFLKVNAPASYAAGTAVRLLGYTAWPKSCTWYAAVWFNGSRYLVNPIYREE